MYISILVEERRIFQYDEKQIELNYNAVNILKSVATKEFIVHEFIFRSINA